MKNRLICIVVSLLMLLLTFSGCAAGSTTTQTESMEAQSQAEVTDAAESAAAPGETPPETALRYASQQGLPAADVLLDAASQLGRDLDSKALPTTLFYDAQGRLQAVRAGELSAATLAQHLGRITASGTARQASK